MSTSVANYAFMQFVISAKLHKMLDHFGRRFKHRSEEETLLFDQQLEIALRALDERKVAPIRHEARHAELFLIKRDVDIIETLYRDFVQHEGVSETVSQRFDKIFSEMKEKIREKETAF